MMANGTMRVCLMWFNHEGKKASSAAGNTSSRSIAHKAQKVSATNYKKTLLNVYIIYICQFFYTIAIGKTRDPKRKSRIVWRPWFSLTFFELVPIMSFSEHRE